MTQWKKVAVAALLTAACVSKYRREPARAQTPLPPEETETAVPEEPMIETPGEQPGQGEALLDGTAAEPAGAPELSVNAQPTSIDNMIRFDARSCNMTEDTRQELSGHVEWLLAEPTRTIVIDVSTGDTSSPDYDVNLTRQRARIAEGYLLKMGVQPSQIVIIPEGDIPPADIAAQQRRTLLLGTRAAAETAPTSRLDELSEPAWAAEPASDDSSD